MSAESCQKKKKTVSLRIIDRTSNFFKIRDDYLLRLCLRLLMRQEPVREGPQD